MMDIRSASKTKVKVSASLTLHHLSMGEVPAFINFSVLGKLVVPVLLGTTYIKRFIKLVHPSEGKVIPYRSQPVPILMRHEAMRTAKDEKAHSRQKDTKRLALLMTPSRFERQNITVVRQVVLKAMLETSVLTSTQAAGLMNMIFHENLAKNRTCMTAIDVMDAYRGLPFYITIANFERLMSTSLNIRGLVKS